MLAALVLLLHLGCASRVVHGLQRAEVRLVERALVEGETATANQALGSLTLLGPDALPLLPLVLSRADQGDLEQERLAALLEAMGPGAVDVVEPRLPAEPRWLDAGLDGLSRLGPEGGEALLRLSHHPRLQEEAWEKVRVMVGWAQHSWVKPGERQRHPYLLPAAMFTPLDLATQQDEVLARACELVGERPPSGERAADVIRAIGDPSCALPWLDGRSPSLFQAAVDVLPRTGPWVEPTVREIEGLLRAGRARHEHDDAQLARYLLGLPPERPEGRAAVLRLLSDGPASTRTILLGALPREATPELQALVVALVADEQQEERVRTTALVRLCQWRVSDPELIDLLLRVGPSLSSIRTIASALSVLPTRDLFVAAATDPRRDLRERALAAAAVPTPRPLEVETALHLAARDSSLRFRALATSLLAEACDPAQGLPDPRREATLRRALQDPAPEVRVAAQKGLNRLALLR